MGLNLVVLKHNRGRGTLLFKNMSLLFLLLFSSLEIGVFLGNSKDFRLPGDKPVQNLKLESNGFTVFPSSRPSDHRQVTAAPFP